MRKKTSFHGFWRHCLLKYKRKSWRNFFVAIIKFGWQACCYFFCPRSFTNFVIRGLLFTVTPSDTGSWHDVIMTSANIHFKIKLPSSAVSNQIVFTLLTIIFIATSFWDLKLCTLLDKLHRLTNSFCFYSQTQLVTSHSMKRQCRMLHVSASIPCNQHVLLIRNTTNIGAYTTETHCQ
jgi:hypothetical protein